MKKSKILISAFCALSIVAAGSAFIFNEIKNNASNNVTASEYVGSVKDPYTRTTYFINELVEIGPKDIVYNDGLLTCTNFYIIYPNGLKKSGTSHRLTELGEYQIVYISDNGGTVVQATEKIYAYNKAYSCTKEASSTNFIEKITLDQKEQSGIATYLAEGDTWTFNQAIDISKAGLDTPILKYYTRQNSELGNHMSLDVDTTVIRLTDFYDSNNYIEITNTYNVCNTSTGRTQPFVLAGAKGQSMVGLDLLNRASSTVNYNGTIYQFHNKGAWGASLDIVPGRLSPITGKSYSPDIANSDNRGFSIYYNDFDKTIYVYHNTMHIVTDLDEPALYGNTLFGGFKTGEVILSFSCKTYKEALAYFEISEINGIKGEDLNKEYAFDDKAPVITLSNDANNFRIAKGEEFKIFDAKVADPHLIGGVTAEVYFDYGTANQRYVPLNDGKFTPNSVGEYTIVYTAQDTFGNIAKKEVVCNSITSSTGEIVSLTYQPTSSAPAGSYITLNTPTVTGYNEGLFTKITAISETGEDVQEIDPNNPTFLLKRVGNYTIKVEYGDVACSKVKEYTLVSEPSENAYLEQTIFPKYFIKGSKTTLDENKAVLCKTKEVQYGTTSIYVKQDGGAYGFLPIDPENFEVTANSTIQFKYVCNKTNIFESDPIDVVDVDFVSGIDMTKYFVGNISSEASATNIKFTTDANNGNAQIEFINPLSFNLNRLNLAFNKTKGFKYFNVIMKDYYNQQEDFVMKFFYSGSALNVNVNGSSSEIGAQSFISLSYDSINKSLAFGGGFSLSINNPFKLDKFYLTLQYEQLTDYCGFKISSLNNQTLSNLNFDQSAPQISYARLRGQRNIDTTVNITRSSACDVFSPYLKKNHKMTVSYKTSTKDATSSFVTSIDGTLLNGSENPNADYTIKFNKHGVYTITYSYADQAYSYGYSTPNEVKVSEVIYVNDNESPIITIEGATSSTVDTATVNKEVTIRNYSVEDESETTVEIYACSPNNRMVKIENMKFTPDVKGDWYIIYYATDANNNVASAQYKLRVK